MKYRLSYNDLEWKAVMLEPRRYTLRDGVPVSLQRQDHSVFRAERDTGGNTAVIGMPAGTGKISDAGYDQMICLAARIPVYEDVVFHGTVRILRYTPEDERNGQEGIGLFFRDTVAPDPQSGYPYSNMVAAGIFGGRPGIAGRDGIADDTEHVRDLSQTADTPAADMTGKELEIVLGKHGARLYASVSAADGSVACEFSITAEEEVFSSREPETMYAGFLAARGCEIEIHTDTVEIGYGVHAGDDMPVLHVSAEGLPAGRGTEDSPLDLQSAILQCQDGQEIRVLPGRYLLEEDLVIPQENSGGKYARKRISGTDAVLDFGGREKGFRMNGDYWDISGLTVTAGFGFMIRGNRNRISRCRAAANLETGFLIRHPANDAPRECWPHHNEITDCESFLNRDPSQQNADGFACKIAAGEGNSFVRCTAWLNSDDGFDLFAKNRRTGAVRLEGCRSLFNGYVMEDGVPVVSRGNGTGFKLGGSGVPADHEARDCEAEGNRGYGFTGNSNPRMHLKDCRAADNRKNYVYYFSGPAAYAESVMENCTEEDDPAFDPAERIRECVEYHADDPVRSVLKERFSGPAEIPSGLPDNADVRQAVKAVRTLQAEMNDDRERILVMCSSLYGGGAERVACRLADGLSDEYQVIMLYIRDKGQTYDLDPAVRVLKIPYFAGSLEERMASRTAFVTWVKEVLDIRVSVSFMFTMNRLNTESEGRAKVICSERNDPVHRDPDHMQDIEAFYRNADHVVFQSEGVRNEFPAEVHSHSSVILNPVSVPCERTGGRHRIVNAGRLTGQKNQAVLMEAFAAFRKTHPGYTLDIYGEGELAEELQALAESLGVQESVQFHGQVKDLHTAIADAEMFVLSSDYEGLSNALLECMMMGFPCISTRCMGSVEVIRDGENGLLADTGNAEQLCDAMSRLADDPGLRERLGEEARNTSVRFAADAVIGEWKALIRRLSEES